MNKKFFLLCAFLVFATVTGCKDDSNEPESIQIKSLVGTSWKFVGFFDVEENDLKEVDRGDAGKWNYDWCYELRFETDSTYKGAGCTNFIYGEYYADYSSSKFEIIRMGRTAGSALFDELLFLQALFIGQAFELSDGTLKLYYDDKKNYLLFNEVME